MNIFFIGMGYMGVENALKLANGEIIPDNIDTGTVLVTKENAADFMQYLYLIYK